MQFANIDLLWPAISPLYSVSVFVFWFVKLCADQFIQPTNNFSKTTCLHLAGHLRTEQVITLTMGIGLN